MTKSPFITGLHDQACWCLPEVRDYQFCDLATAELIQRVGTKDWCYAKLRKNLASWSLLLEKKGDLLIIKREE